MARTSPVEWATVIDKMFSEVNAAELLAGMMGGVAASGGVVPPFTRLLMMFGNTSGSMGGSNLNADLVNLWAITTNPVNAGMAFWQLIFGGMTGSTTGTTPTQSEITQAALFASGFMEGMIMYNVMKNPTVLTTLIQQPAEIAKAIGEIVPG